MSWIALRYKSRLLETGQMVGGKWCSAAVGDEAGAVCLGEPGCNPLLGISRHCRKEHGGRVEQGRMGKKSKKNNR